MRLKVILIAVCLCLSGFTWSKTMIYSGMQEQEINEMLVLLLANDIDSSRSEDKNGFSIHVDTTKVARALRLVHSHGLPRDKFLSLGDVFDNDGIISSPQQEEIRFVYALSQELEETITNIENVLIARVHIVLVSDNDLGETIYPSSASVFIKHRSNSQLPQLVPRIKHLVANSVPGLSYEKVNVVLFETTIPELSITPTQAIGINWLLLGGIGMVLLLLVTAVAVFLYRRRQNTKVQLTAVKPEAVAQDSLDFAVSQNQAAPTDKPAADKQPAAKKSAKAAPSNKKDS